MMPNIIFAILMPFFPAQYSTLSAKALNTYLQQRYALEETTCSLLVRNVSDTYVLTHASTKYIFKIYRDAHRKIEEIKGEVELLSLLAKGGAKVSYPIADAQGEMLQCFKAAEGIRYGVLFSWAEGEVVYAMSDEQLDIVGTEMAKIHLITSAIGLNHYRKPYTAITTVIEPLEKLRPAFKDLEEEYTYLKTTGEAVAERIQKYQGQPFSYGYCHYDFFPKNFHVTAGNQITFFDFDFAGEGLLAYDITSFFIHYFLEVTYGKRTVDEGRRAFQTFVESYRRVRPLSDEEIKAIPDLGFAFWVFYLNFQYENYDDWSNSFFGTKFIRERVALIKKWMETAGSLLP